MKEFDKIIIGAGLYGLYSALYCCRNKQKVLIIECENAPFKRATLINQARVHLGYHYPRSISTALRSVRYFEKFNRDFDFCINRDFDQIYATSENYSWTDAEQFKYFCRSAGIPCIELPAEKYFKSGMCDGAFLTKEYTYDARIMKDYFINELDSFGSAAEFRFDTAVREIRKDEGKYIIRTSSGESFASRFVLNATYAGVNQIAELAGTEKFKIKYELCELLLCNVSSELSNIGITVMDGPFFSIMPYGKTGMHSLTSVTFTPHLTSYNELPSFPCQHSNNNCSPSHLGNCNDCPNRPDSALPYMTKLAKKYLRDEYDFYYKSSIFSMKPILMSSEIDDSRPTVIKIHSKNPTLISVLSGKINTVYDLNEVLTNE